MRVKKFRAPDRASALRQIKAEMGTDAVILQEHQVRSGPMGLFGKPEVEILAALEEGEPPMVPHPDRTPAPPRQPARTTKSAAAQKASTAGRSDGEVEATISGAGRRAARAAQDAPGSPPATARTTKSGAPAEDGPAHLAAILDQLRRDGTALSPDVAERLADAIAHSADPSLGDLFAQAAANTSASPVGGGDSATPSPVPDGYLSAPGGALTRPTATNGAMNGTTNAASSHPTGNPGPAANARAAPAQESSLLRQMERMLGDLRSTVDRIRRQSQPARPSREASTLRTVYQRLMDQEVDPGLGLELMGQIAEELGDADPGLAAVQSRLVDLIRAELPVQSLDRADYDGRVTGDSPAGGPQVLVLVGPTGVGKTTTVAKLAAYLSLRATKQVCLVTTDTFRIAAAAQLGTYADIMRLPLEVVYAATDLPAAIAKHAGADYIIVDTPGCGQHNEPQLRELAAFVDAAVGAAPDATVLLAVAAPTKLSDMLEVQDRFGALPLDGLILTKLDETSAFGPLLSLVRRADRPVYYVTTGQNVPNDIEEASADHLARLVVGNVASPVSLASTPAAQLVEPAGAVR